MFMIIRKAKSSDAREVIEINIKTWNTTYKGIIPDYVLKQREMLKEESIKKCEKTVELRDNVLVIEYDNKMVGVVSYGKAKLTDKEDYGEIYSLYVLNEYHGKNIGKSLFLAAREELVKKGYPKLILSCIKANPSNGFYKKMGGKVERVIISNIGGAEIEENVIVFD